MQRSIPFYTQRIVPEAVNKGKRVLVTSHENAIRGILMHLCDIPEEAMNQLHLPNGLPLVSRIVYCSCVWYGMVILKFYSLMNCLTM